MKSSVFILVVEAMADFFLGSVSSLNLQVPQGEFPSTKEIPIFGKLYVSVCIHMQSAYAGPGSTTVLAFT